MSTHTPTPWRWWTSNSVRRLSSDVTGKDGDVLHAAMVSNPPYADIVVSDANAAHIVRCVNAHDDLVAALRAVDAHYSASLDRQPAYVRLARAALAKVMP